MWFCSTFFVKIYKSSIANIWWMIRCHLLKLSVVWNFHHKIVCRIQCNRFLYSKKDCVIKQEKRYFKIFTNCFCMRVPFLYYYLPCLLEFKYLPSQVMMFHWIFPNHPCIHTGKNTFSKQQNTLIHIIVRTFFSPNVFWWILLAVSICILLNHV